LYYLGPTHSYLKIVVVQAITFRADWRMRGDHRNRYRPRRLNNHQFAAMKGSGEAGRDVFSLLPTSL
jgi:hypothetical protein